MPFPNPWTAIGQIQTETDSDVAYICDNPVGPRLSPAYNVPNGLVRAGSDGKIASSLLSAGSGGGGTTAGSSSNIMVNGCHQISQERGSAILTLASGVYAYATDQWQVTPNSIGVEVQQVGSAIPGYSKALRLTIPVATTGGHFLGAFQPIERSRIAHIGLGTPNAKPSRIGIWACASAPGKYTISLRNGAKDVAWLGSITIAAADVPQHFILDVPAITSGVWGTTDNAVGAYLGVCVSAVNSTPSPEGVVTGNQVIASGQVNLAANAGAKFEFTGMIFAPEVPSVDKAWMAQRAEAEELWLSQRYHQPTRVEQFYIHNTPALYMHTPQKLVVPMRTNPVITLPSSLAGLGLNSGGGNITPSTMTAVVSSPTAWHLTMSHTAAIGGHVGFNAIANARMA